MQGVPPRIPPHAETTSPLSSDGHRKIEDKLRRFVRLNEAHKPLQPLLHRWFSSLSLQKKFPWLSL
eukprot:2334502-Pyramimonas_sp.AAC.1